MWQVNVEIFEVQIAGHLRRQTRDLYASTRNPTRLLPRAPPEVVEILFSLIYQYRIVGPRFKIGQVVSVRHACCIMLWMKRLGKQGSKLCPVCMFQPHVNDASETGELISPNYAMLCLCTQILRSCK